MIVHQPKRFINNEGKLFELPFDDFDEYDRMSSIIEFRSKVVIEFSTPDGHEADHRNIICFNRGSGEVLWLIEESHGRWLPENNRNMYLEETWDHPTHYGSMDVFYRSAEGHAWIEEEYNAERQRWVSDPVGQGRLARHPEYREPEGKYRYVKMDGYWVRCDTHELVLRDWDEEDERLPEERGYCDVVYYADMTAYAEENCLLVAQSAYYVFYFEVDLATGKVTPAYAVIEETK